MYAAHFGLTSLPFENVPDPAFYFNEGDYQRVFTRIWDAIAAGRGLLVVAGPMGSGKTTLSQKLMPDLGTDTVYLWCAEPPLSDQELFRLLGGRLGLDLHGQSRVQALAILREKLIDMAAQGTRCLLIIDESHKCSDDGLEALRLLNNLEQGASKLIQMLLLGQEELLALLKAPGHEAFRQRVANLEILGRMNIDQTRAYVQHRLKVAGATTEIIPALLIDAIAVAAGGIPRVINSFCDRALLYAFERGRSTLTEKDVLAAAEDVGLYRQTFHALQANTDVAPASPAPPPSTPDDDRHDDSAAPAHQIPTIEPAMPTDAGAALWHNPTMQSGIALALGVAALVGSLLFYCGRAADVYGDECILSLLRDLFT
jgi:general secretion pathway protein A